MIQGIQYRKSTFLGNPEWLTLPWGEAGKDIYQQLYDKGFVLAALLEEMDNSKSTKDNINLSLMSEFMGRLSSLNEELNIWFQDILQEYPSPLYWHAQSTSPIGHTEGSVDPGIRPPFAFRNLLLANTIVTYWGLRLILSITVALICQHVLSMTTQATAHQPSSTTPRKLQDLHTMSIQLLRAHTGASSLELATNIVRSMPYCLDDNMGLTGAQKSLFAMRIALFVLQRHPGEELKRCEAMYQELNTKKGIRYAREIAKLEGKFKAPGQDSYSTRTHPPSA